MILPTLRSAPASWRRRLFAAVLAGHAALTVFAEDFATWIKPYAWLPEGQATPGSTITLRSSAPAEPGAAYQWYFNGAPLAGATSRELVLAGLTVAQTGNYFYRRTVGGVTAESSWTTVNVLAQPERPSPVDTSFVAQLPDDGQVRMPVAVLADGSVVLTPSVAPAPGVGAGSRYLRLRADGSLDATYSLPESAGTILATDPTGNVITSDAPYRFDRNGVARPIVFPAHFDAAQPLSAAAFYPDGRAVLAQTLLRTDTFAGGVTLTWHYSRLARVLADGTADASLTVTAESSGFIEKLAIDATDRILVGRRIPGSIQEYPTRNTIEAYLGTSTHLERYNADGSRDTGFTTASVSHPWYLQWSVLADGRILTDLARGVHLLQLREADGTPVAGWKGAATSWYYYSVAPDGRVLAHSGLDPVERWHLEPTPTRDLDFYSGMPTDGRTASGLRAFDNRFVLVWGNFTDWDGHPSPRLVRLRTDGVVPQQFLLTAAMVDTVEDIATTLIARPQGIGPFTYQWFALDGQPLPADTTSATLALGAPHYTKLGRYQVRVTGPQGSLLGPVLNLRPIHPLRLLGLSGRAEVGTGEDVLIAGAVVQTSTGWPEKILVRGAGPALQQYGLGNTVSDPALAWFDGANVLQAENDNWENSDAINAATATAGLAPFATGSRDATLLQTWVTPGNYTIHLRNRGTSDGIGLLELYDLGDTRVGELDSVWGDVAGLSLRGRVGAAEKVLIGGFIVRDPHQLGGGRNLRVLLRATGPALAQYGIARPLGRPRITLYNARGETLATNLGWSTATNADAIASTAATIGLAALPANSADSALLVDLPAGAYTAQVSSADGSAGVALLELYRVR